MVGLEQLLQYTSLGTAWNGIKKINLMGGYYKLTIPRIIFFIVLIIGSIYHFYKNGILISSESSDWKAILIILILFTSIIVFFVNSKTKSK